MTLRKKIIRLAYENPSLRKDLLPLVTKSAKTENKQLLRAKEISLKGLGIYKVVGVDKKIGDISLKEMGGRKEYTLSITLGGSLLGNGAELKGRGKTRMRTKFIQGKDITVLR